jgi:decaprenylphospho-beta-D-erythro-pentofuranosid-2-ulose 2-reductase
VTSAPVLILGGYSDIGLAIAHRFAAQGHPIQLAARQIHRLADDARDIQTRHRVTVELIEFDILASDRFETFITSLPAAPETVVCVVGLLGKQEESEQDWRAAEQVLRSNFEGPALILGLFANRFETAGRGTIIGVSSVAGDRGRATNYVYGSAKAGFTAFLSGLRNRLAKKGVKVVTVLPGFVATRMTAEMKLPRALTTSPQHVAEAVAQAVQKNRDVIYVAPIWRLIMFVIRHLPETIFKRLRI